MRINEIMERYNLSTADIAKRFEIPYRTVQNWKLNTNKCPDYIVKMMAEVLEKESR